MAIIAVQRTATITTTPYSLANGSTTFTSTIGGPANCWLLVDATAMAAGDEFLIEVLTSIAGGTQRVLQRYTLRDTNGAVFFGPFPGAKSGFDVSVKKISGTNRSLLMDLMYEVSEAIPTTIAAAVWDELKAGHAVANSFGAYLDTTVSSRLAPTVAARTLDVSTGGEAGVDWANIGSPTTVVGLSGTTVKNATDVLTDTTNLKTRLPAALVAGRIDSSVGAMDTDVLTASALAASAVTEIQSGLATATAVAGVQTDTTNIKTRLPAALVAGRMDSSIGAMAAGVLTAASIAADALTAIKQTILSHVLDTGAGKPATVIGTLRRMVALATGSATGLVTSGTAQFNNQAGGAAFSATQDIVTGTRTAATLGAGIDTY